ncbi:unnamed protein product, partial [Gulo gulo]
PGPPPPRGFGARTYLRRSPRPGPGWGGAGFLLFLVPGVHHPLWILLPLSLQANLTTYFTKLLRLPKLKSFTCKMKY